MEKNFYRDQFEQMLKDTADSFRMYPSRKIWHSIYNDIHPARKWPSFAVLLLLTASIMYIGVTNPDTATSDKSATDKIVFAKNESVGKYIQFNKQHTGKQHQHKNSSLTDIAQKDAQDKVSSSTTNRSLNVVNETNVASFVKNNYKKPDQLFDLSIRSADQATAETNTIITESADAESESTDGNSTLKHATAVTTDAENYDELSWKDDMALYAKQQRAKDRFSYQIYATPSIGYRTLTNHANMVNNSRDALIADPEENNYFINHTNSFNLEFGGNVLYKVNEKFRVKAGVQLNVTSYLINAFVLSHPVTTNLLLTDQNTGLLFVEPRATMISNSQALANTYLNNSTFQFSVPLGADVEIVRYKKLKLLAGATLQPTYISGGNAYLLSTDMKNYVNDPSMLRKFNLNGGVETFVSYQLKNGVSLNAGPQVRYQFLSTYSNQYSYSEKLYNFGVKFGITSKF